MMKSARVEKYGGPILVLQEPIPQPNENEVLIEIQACGLCHTDIHAINGDWDVKPGLPFCPGHEGAGIIRQIGSNVTNFKLGDHAGVSWLYFSCGLCEYCNTGWETLCEHQKICGYTVPGCFRKYIVVPASHAVPIPVQLELYKVAPLLCAGVTSYKALKVCDARPGQFVCIIGAAGGLGHLAVQYATAMGFRVIAVDLNADSRDYCLKLGAEHFIAFNSAKETPLSPLPLSSSSTFSEAKAEAEAEAVTVSEITNYTSGGCHAVLVIAPHLSAYSLGVSACRRRGTVVCVSLPKGRACLDMGCVVMKALTLRGSIVGTRQDMHEALDFAARGKVECDVTRERLENINIVIDEMVHCKVRGRVVFDI